MEIKKLVIVGTLLTCAIALLFPPWGYGGESGHFQTFSFILSKVPVAGFEILNVRASIIWPILALEIGAILSIGFALYFLTQK